MTLTAEDLKKLSAPLPDDSIGVKVQSFNRERTRALLVQYLQHTDVYARLEQVDPGWSCETHQLERAKETVVVAMKMTVKGITRENVGEGEDFKSAYSDAIKRCAMLFGVGRWLYDTDKVWVEYDENRDKYKAWTMADFNGARPRAQSQPSRPPVQPNSPAGKAAPPSSKGPAKAPVGITQAQRKRLFAIADEHGWSEISVREKMQQLFRTDSTQKITQQQYEILVKKIEESGVPA